MLELDPAQLERRLYALEVQLMQPATRSSRKSLEELLAEDFVEIASTGVVYGREEVISALLLEQPPAWSVASFHARHVAEGVALVTYLATKGGGEISRRCSVWKLAEGRWRMVFHQGTRSEG